MTNRDTKKIVQISTLTFFFVFIVIYALFNARAIILGVKIKDIKIEHSDSQYNVLKLTGNAKNATNVTINGREISIDQWGNFNETIMLLSGYNVITIKAEDKFGYKDEEDYKLIGI